MNDAKAKAYEVAGEVLKNFMEKWTQSPSREVAMEVWEIAEALERAAKARKESP